MKRKILERAESIAFEYVSSEIITKELERLKPKNAAHENESNRYSWFTSIGLSYAQKLIAKILANIEITISNIHFRYEDKIINPGYIVSVGLTLESVAIATTDSQWNQRNSANLNSSKQAKDTTWRTSKPDDTPESTSASSSSRIMYKLITLRNLSVYWNVNDLLSASLFEKKTKAAVSSTNSNLAWNKLMQSFIHQDESVGDDNLERID